MIKMNNFSLLAAEIKEKIKMPELVEFYGYKLDRNKRICCPFHNGIDKNCGVKDDYIHCFVCGEGGDHFTFMKVVFGLNFTESIKKINQDFMLGLPVGEEKISLRKKREIEEKCRKNQKEKQERIKKTEKLKSDYWSAFDIYADLEKKLQKNIPKNENELSQNYADVLHSIDAAKFNLELCEMRLLNDFRR